MDYAIIENGVVVNIISLNDTNAFEFPNAVCVDTIPVAIGDTHTNGQFYGDDNSSVMNRQDNSGGILDEQDALYIDMLYQEILLELEV
ncbi:MAG TPA: hypothetical protein PKU80_09825 [Candidatus Limiplasma sp.]|nr:hypothetical protein [Candidatus Limiplasma sp.]